MRQKFGEEKISVFVFSLKHFVELGEKFNEKKNEYQSRNASVRTNATITFYKTSSEEAW